MTRGWRSLWMAGALMGCAAAQGWAQWTNRPRAGASLGGHWSYTDPVNGAEADSAGGLNLRFYGGYLALDLLGDYRKRSAGPLDLREFPLSGSLLFYFLDMPVSPYAMVGGDWVVTDVDGPGGFNDTQHRFGWHVGGGIQAMLNAAWSIDAAYRHVWIEDVQGVDTTLVPSRFDDNIHWITAGLNFHFGGAE